MADPGCWAFEQRAQNRHEWNSLEKDSSHAVISSEPVKSSRIRIPKGFPSFLENRFSTDMMRPASLNVPGSVASFAWAMVLYFPESKFPA
jgi:hypothetical protein